MEEKVVWRTDAPPAAPLLGAGPYRYAIGVPARDEAALIGPCLEALAAQADAPDFAVAIVLNNCTDGTAEAIAALPPLPFALHVFNVELADEFANAAWARRLAMNAAMSLVGEDGVVLTSDADSRVDQTWVSSIAACFSQGADVVCGFVSPDFSDAPPLSFDAVRRGALEFEYSQLTAELTSALAPHSADPWPNHMIETGANLAIRARALLDLGGVPHICPGEDQRLVAMARRRGYLIRHAFAPSVVTSSRVRGRAAGGWSDDLNARLLDERAHCHPKLEEAQALMRRLATRARLRRVHADAAKFERAVKRLAPHALETILEAPHFEAAWARLEDASPLLARQPLLVRDLEASVVLLRERIAELAAQPAQTEAVTLGSK